MLRRKNVLLLFLAVIVLVILLPKSLTKNTPTSLITESSSTQQKPPAFLSPESSRANNNNATNSNKQAKILERKNPSSSNKTPGAPDITISSTTTTVHAQTPSSNNNDSNKDRNTQISTTLSTSTHHHNNNCGLYYYYHIGKTGGTSVQKWQEKIARKSNGEIHFKRWWYLSEYKTGIWKKDLDDVIIPLIHNITNSAAAATTNNNDSNNNSNKKMKWLSLHQHHRTPGMRTMIPLLRQWREQLQTKGCGMVTAITLREPISWIQSLLSYNRIPNSELVKQLTYPTERQGKYLLWNFFSKYEEAFQPMNQSLFGINTTLPLSSNEIDEVITYLEHDFDIVGQTNDLTSFLQKSMSLTGWDSYYNINNNNTSSSSPTTTSSSAASAATATAIAPHMNRSDKRFYTQEIAELMKSSVHQDQIIFRHFFNQTSKPILTRPLLQKQKQKQQQEQQQQPQQSTLLPRQKEGLFPRQKEALSRRKQQYLQSLQQQQQPRKKQQQQDAAAATHHQTRSKVFTTTNTNKGSSSTGTPNQKRGNPQKIAPNHDRFV